MPDSPSSTPPNSSGPKPAPVKVFIEGRYRKLSRDLPQTKFYCPKCKGKGCPTCEGFGKLTRDSVQELLAWVAMPRFKARRNKFHGAGREDMDVRMLGEGRPFVFEVLRAKNPQIDLEELAAEVNRRNEGRLELTGLRYSNKKRVVELKEMRCAKEYRALVACELPWEEVEPRLAELAAGGPITLIQTTPQRVAHRRAHLDRERWIELLAWERAAEDEEGSFWLSVRSQHGTYIKEAISGDDGRCKPALSELLGAPCTCAALDVLAILPPDGADAPDGDAPVADPQP